MNILWTILIGFFVGLLARFLMPGRDSMGFIFTTLLGIAGALVAQFLGQALNLYGPEEPAGLIASVIGALLVLFVARRFRTRAA
jgi:uncharacterized membrane protein YeaQ/YmgE (transglycosylase-associated protein family)